MKHLNRLETLVAIMDRLREPGGCPWDREQDYGTLRSYLLEESYEVAEALDHADAPGLCEELGDLLLQIVFLSRLGKEDGTFTIEDVIRSISEKMIRRHPHVFGDESAETSDEVLRNWEKIKSGEKKNGGRHSRLDGIPAALPALLAALRLGEKAARAGFDWERSADVLDKADEELGELREAVDSASREAISAELGDLLFTLVMLARRLDLDPEGALARANLKFRRRFNAVEAELERRGIPIHDAGAGLMDDLWNEVKAGEADAD